MISYEEWINYVLDRIQDAWDAHDNEDAICAINKWHIVGASYEDAKAAWKLLDEMWSRPQRCTWRFIANGRRVK